MKRMLFNATYQEELRVATVEGQKLIDFDIETTSKTQRKGNIYKGIVTRVEPSLEACFVDYGTEKQGFLPFKEIDSSYLPETTRHRDFNRMPEGTELIIQVEKDERGNKGAALTTYVSLPGRYLVLMPNNSRSGGISRRIDGDERDELKGILASLNIPDDMSFIARTAALGRFPEELQWDLNYLLKLWSAITTAAENQSGSFLIYQESNLVVRSIRDHFSPDITEILIDTQEIYDQARQFISHVMPNFADKVKFYNDDVPLFSRFQIEHQIETAYGRIVHLPSGGSIAIDHTEALTAIDVNSARANKGSDIGATAFATNLEASDEIARQLRLRDLGGLVVVDFIDMESQKNQREVEVAFKQHLGLDRARIQMGKLSKFGLLELSRQRLQASLEESTTVPCPRCVGVGSIRGTESTAVHILRLIQEEVVKNSSSISQLHVQLPVAVATYLLNEKRDDVAKIESRMKVKIILIPNVHLDSPHYKIRKVGTDGHEVLANKLSYTLAENLEDNILYQVNQKKSDTSLQNNAIVKNIVPSQPAPVIVQKIGLGRILDKFIRTIKARFMDNKHVLVEAKKSVLGKPLASNSKQAMSNRINNKVRPVGVNRSNNKIQTVKQNTTKPLVSKSESNEKYDNVIPNKLHHKTIANRDQKSRPSQPTVAPTTKPQLAIKVVNESNTAINQPWQQPLASTSLPDSLPHNEIQQIITPVVICENTITKSVDLGSFEMVSTDSSLFISNQQPIDTAKADVKRYNDIEVDKINNVLPVVEYDLVETKAQ